MTIKLHNQHFSTKPHWIATGRCHNRWFQQSNGWRHRVTDKRLHWNIVQMRSLHNDYCYNICENNVCGKQGTACAWERTMSSLRDDFMVMSTNGWKSAVSVGLCQTRYSPSRSRLSSSFTWPVIPVHASQIENAHLSIRRIFTLRFQKVVLGLVLSFLRFIHFCTASFFLLYFCNQPSTTNSMMITIEGVMLPALPDDKNDWPEFLLFILLILLLCQRQQTQDSTH